MNQIKFSHIYPKLHGQQYAKLLTIKYCDRKELCDEFVEYDTVYENSHYQYIGEQGSIKLFDKCGHYPLPAGKYLVLVFLGDKLIPFTTVRAAWPKDKAEFYQNAIGQIFEIVLVEEKAK